MYRLSIAIRRAGSVAAIGAAFLVTAPSARAQGKITVKEEKPGLLKKAKITADSATTVALAAVPGSTLKSAEIEREKGKLIYSFDLTIAGQSGIEEVNVDAITGKVLGREHEDAAAEKKEEAAEAAKKKKKP